MSLTVMTETFPSNIGDVQIGCDFVEKDWKSNLDDMLLDVYKREGIGKFLEIAAASLSVDPGGDGQFKAKYVGEICEVAYLGLTMEYLRVSKRKAKLFHSVILKDLKDLNGEFRTECDFILASPCFLLTTECKSYAGGITIAADAPCTLVHKGKRSDVYQQSKLHYDHLKRYAGQMVKPGLGLSSVPVLANVFCFSNSAITDLRSKELAKRITVLTTSTLVNYFERLFSVYTRSVFDYQKVCRVFDVCSTSQLLHSQHKQFVGY